MSNPRPLADLTKLYFF